MEIKIIRRTIVYITATILLLALVTGICYLSGADNFFESLEGIDYFSVLSGQIANTLIVLSLTSVLSSNFGQVYWVDIKEEKLVAPFWGCFIGITVYLLTALVFSIIAYVSKINTGVLVSAAFSTLLLIFLTYKMLSIYFGREELKMQLRFNYEYERETAIAFNNGIYIDVLKKLLEKTEQSDYPGKEKNVRFLRKEIKQKEKDKNNGKVKRKEKLHVRLSKLSQEDKNRVNKIADYTRNAIAVNERNIVEENIEFLIDFKEKDGFFGLLEDLFNWDEKYTCQALKKMHTGELVIDNSEIDKYVFFYKYALRKMIDESGNLESIINLLEVYGMLMKGKSVLQSELEEILNKISPRTTKEEKIEIIDKVQSILKNADAEELRSYYIPIEEMCSAYDEGKLSSVKRYLNLISYIYEMDMKALQYRYTGSTSRKFIKKLEPILFDDLRTLQSMVQDSDESEGAAVVAVPFPYITDEEESMIAALIEKDKENRLIPEDLKTKLLRLKNASIMYYINNEKPPQGVIKFKLKP